MYQLFPLKELLDQLITLMLLVSEWDTIRGVQIREIVYSYVYGRTWGIIVARVHIEILELWRPYNCLELVAWEIEVKVILCF